jgi:hybrid cluster-associated redox disulfide protein
MITKDMTIADIVAVNRNIIAILLSAGMHCVGCPSAQGETLEEACMVHGLEVEPILNQINAYLGN